MKQQTLQEYLKTNGKRSLKARVKKLGLKRVQEIARTNGRSPKSGRPKIDWSRKAKTLGYPDTNSFLIELSEMKMSQAVAISHISAPTIRKKLKELGLGKWTIKK